MNVALIRHGKTEGNLLSRYVGVTDEPLCRQGEQELSANVKKGMYPPVQAVFVSPLRRAVQTAELIYPHLQKITDNDLRECDFGAFEGMNHDELGDLPDYRVWLRSGGLTAFPGGEEPLLFRARCRDAFERSLALAMENRWEDIAFVVHGGTIMSILEGFSQDGQGDFYRWQIKNGCGWRVSLESAQWEQEHALKVREKIGENEPQ